jgi:hypothetical protein
MLLVRPVVESEFSCAAAWRVALTRGRIGGCAVFHDAGCSRRKATQLGAGAKPPRRREAGDPGEGLAERLSDPHDS